MGTRQYTSLTRATAVGALILEHRRHFVTHTACGALGASDNGKCADHSESSDSQCHVGMRSML